MKMIAGIVLYQPDINRLQENLDAIIPQVDEVLLIDNASCNINEIEKLLKSYSSCVLIKNTSNLGVASALNEIFYYAKSKGYDWFLTLDQDSVCSVDLIKVYERYLQFENIGIITSKAIDRNFALEEEFGAGERYRYVIYCITSGALMNVDACLKCGGWDEQLFIDNVDGDICINMKIHGFKVLSINYNGILHEVGHGRNVRFLWMKDCIYNHTADRQYYMARNRIYVARKYPSEFSIFRELIKEFRNIRLILFFENEKKKKIAARYKGIIDGFKMPIKSSHCHDKG